MDTRTIPWKNQNKKNEKMASYLVANILLPLLGSKDLARYKSTCASFFDQVHQYQSKLLSNFVYYKKFNEESVFAHQEHVKEIKSLKDAKDTEQELLRAKKALAIAQIEQQYSEESSKIDAKYDSGISRLQIEYAKEIENKILEQSSLEIFLKQHLRLLTEFQGMLDEELQKKWWWTRRIKLNENVFTPNTPDPIGDFISFDLAVGVISLVCGFVLSMPASYFFMTFFLSSTLTYLCIAAAIGFGIGLLVGLLISFNPDFRPIKNRLENDPLSSISPNLLPPFDHIKTQNDSSYMPPIMEVKGNPFAAMDSNITPLKTIYKAITDRILFFKSAQDKIKPQKTDIQVVAKTNGGPNV